MLLVYGRVDLKLYSGFMAEWTSNCAMSSWQSGPQIVLWVFGRGDFSSNRGQHRWPHTQAIAWPWDRWDADKRNEFRPPEAAVTRSTDTFVSRVKSFCFLSFCRTVDT